MFRHTLTLLVTMVVGSLAFGGYNGDQDQDMGERDSYFDRLRPRMGVVDDKYKYDYITRPEYARAKSRALLYATPRYETLSHGNDLMDDDVSRYHLRPADYCDENLDEISSEVDPYSGDVEADDESEQDTRRQHGPYGYGKIGHFKDDDNNPAEWKSRPFYYWRPGKPYGAYARPRWPDRAMNTNSNANSNVLGARRSNVNANINTNNIRSGRRIYPGPGNDGVNPYFDIHPYKLREWPWVPASHIPSTTEPQYPDPRQKEMSSEEDLAGESQNSNVNVNSNSNMLSRRSNVNANKNSNVLTRNRRSVEEPFTETTHNPDNVSTSTVPNLENSTQNRIIEESWGSPRSVPANGIM